MNQPPTLSYDPGNWLCQSLSDPLTTPPPSDHPDWPPHSALPPITLAEVPLTNRYRWLLDHLPDLLCCCTTDGRITYANRAYCQFFQRSEAQLLGLPVWSLLPGSDQARFQQAIAHSQDQPQPLTETVAIGGATVEAAPQRWVTWTFQCLRPESAPLDGETRQPIEILIQGREPATPPDAASDPRRPPVDDQGDRAIGRLPATPPDPVWAIPLSMTDILNHAGVSLASFRLYRDSRWEYDYFSEGCASVFGYTATEFIGDAQLWWSQVDPGDRQRVIVPAQAQLLHGQDTRTEYRFRHKDGRIRWIESILTSRYDAAIDCWHVIAVDSDITPLKQTELQLRQQEANFSALLENIAGSIWAVDHHYRLIIGNTHFQQMMEQGLGHPLQPGDSVLAPAIPAEILAEWQGYYDRALGGEQFSIERPSLYNPTVSWSDHHFNPIRAANGDILGVTVFGQDVTDRWQAKAQLERQAERLREAQRIGRIGSWECDFTQGITTWSEELFEIAGLDPQQPAPGYPDVLALVHPDDRPMYQALIEQSLAMGGSYNTDLRILCADGSLKYIAVHGEAVMDTQGQVIRMLGTAVDITARKRAEIALWQRAERDRLVKTITQNIHQSLDLAQILATTVNDVLGVLQVDRALIFRLYASGAGSVIQVATTPDYPLQDILQWQDACFSDDHHTFYRQGQPRPVDDVLQDDWRDCQAELMHQLGVKSKLVAPILTPSEAGPPLLWGLLIIHTCAQQRVWQAMEVDLLQQIADRLAIAIQQSELYNQVRQFNADLEHQVQVRTAELRNAFEFEATLKRISDHVRDSLDEAKILQTVVQELVYALGVSACNASQYDLERGIAVVNYEYTRLPRPYKNRTIPLAERPEIYETLLQLRSLQFCPLPPDPELGKLLMLVVPIQDNQTSLGDLWLLDNHPGRQFSEQQIRLVEQVANQCAIALRQSRLYHAAQQQVTELERLNQLKDDFLSTVSHELRTPMTNIIMATQVLEILLARANFTEPDAERVDRYFQILTNECRREMNLVNDLLEFSRLETATEPLVFTPVDLGEWLPQLIKPFEERLQQQQQRLALELEANLPPINTHIPSLERIIMELLNNACKYTPAGETIAITSQRITMPRGALSPTDRGPSPSGDRAAPLEESQLRVSICNSGVEIPVAEQERIFERFYRIPQHDPWKYGGTGLGLALVKKMITRIQGEIHVESQNHYTCFALTLPFYDPLVT
ncbi:PAS domain-containing protein [Trichothermofontia sp.]